MSEPSPILDALAIIDADPVLSAVATITVGGFLEANGGRAPAGPMLEAATRIVASRPAADPAKTYTPADLDALSRRVEAILAADAALWQARKRRDAASLHGHDAAEVEVQSAARVLAGLVGGAR